MTRNLGGQRFVACAIREETGRIVCGRPAVIMTSFDPAVPLGFTLRPNPSKHLSDPENN